METLLLYESDSKLIKKEFAQNFNIVNSNNNEFIKVSGKGQGTILNIQISSIKSCVFQENGELVIETGAGRKIIFKSNSKKGSIKLCNSLNKILEISNCSIRFSIPKDEEYTQILQNLDNNPQQEEYPPPNIKSILITGFIILISFGFILSFTILTNSSNKDETISSPVAKDNSTKKLEEDEKNENNTNLKQSSSASQSNDTKIASVILTISCAGNKGLIARNQMGSMMKKMFADEGINSTEVYENWDYYWGLAKEMDTVNKTYCLK